jgi:hypothetical protein
MRSIIVVCFLFSLCTSAVSAKSEAGNKKQPAAQRAKAKIQFDVKQIDADGLRGPANGKVAVSYEFKIPNTPAARAEVKAIDSSIQFMAGSRGRIGAGKDECLCIGSTYQKDFRTVLKKLAQLDYIDRIIECYFE